MIVETEAFLADGVQEHVEALHGIVRLIIVRVTPFRRPLGTFSSINNFHRVGEAKRGVAFLQSARSLLHVRVRRDRMRAKYHAGHTTPFLHARALFFA